MRLFKPLAITAAAILTLSGCSANNSESAAPDAGPDTATSAAASVGSAGTSDSTASDGAALLARHGLEGLDAEGIITQLDATPKAQRDNTLMASIGVNELVLSDEQGQTSLPMPADKFYVSMAPFINQTHQCYYHSLTTCTGELSQTPIDIKIVDDKGATILDEKATTFDNGFYGVWLPRDMSGTLEINAEGKSLTTPISTGQDDPTCLTTTQLT